jgi:deoxycytidine triphosphate deaminase
MTQLFPEDFDQTLLWRDPLEETAVPGTVLRAEELQAYVEKFNLIIDKETFAKGKLKGASYSTNPDASEGWIMRKKFGRKGRQQRLLLSCDARGEHFIVPPNSFVFIRLLQRLRIPFYLIGRFNLKIRYVYRGLLLGTGPQIDPGYTGRIYIPLHNFTNEPVNIYTNESFVSFEFERTSPIKLPGKSPTTLDEFYDLYQDRLHLIDRKKIHDRDHLDAYLEGARPYSALGVLVKQLRKMRWEFRRRKVIEWAFVTGIVLIVIAYAASTYGLFDSKKNREGQLQQQIHDFSKERIQGEAALRAQMDVLTEKVRKLTEEFDSMKPKQNVTPSLSPINKEKK